MAALRWCSRTASEAGPTGLRYQRLGGHNGDSYRVYVQTRALDRAALHAEEFRILDLATGQEI